MKKILLLPATWFQLPPIRYARQRGYHVITCDNEPANPGHALAHERLQISTVDKEAILRAAERIGIDGVVCYGSDVAAPTAAYVAEQMGLPGNPYHSVVTLTDKGLFRRYLQDHGFEPPGFCVSAELWEIRDVAERIGFPLMVKPVDSSGSKGITRIHHRDELEPAFAFALSHSRVPQVIVEKFIDKRGHQLTGDGFLVDGKIVFRTFANQHFSPQGKPYFPVGESVPAAFEEATLARIQATTQRLMDSLDMRTGALNFDVLVDAAGNVHLIEIGPRAGGNSIPVLIEHARGVNLAGAVVEAALGHEVDLRGDGAVRPHASCNLVDLLKGNGLRGGPANRRISLALGENLPGRLVFEKIVLRSGEELELAGLGGAATRSFHPGDLALGWLLFEFADAASMVAAMDEMDLHVRILES